MKIRPVILCGGAGTRLWPKSKKNTPKQFIDWGGWTLFEKTLVRVKNKIYDYPIITTNASYVKLVKKFLVKQKIKKYKIILEPFKKNTAPAILTSILIKEIPSNQPVIFFPSDNLLGNIKQFNRALNDNKKNLSDKNIFIFGIKPKNPSSEYGYFLSKKISKNINKVYQFIEKPNKKKLNIIIKKKAYMNSGMFFAKKESLIKHFIKYQNRMFYNCLKSINKSKLKQNVYYLNKPYFKKINEISFDYAILEKSKNVNGIKLNMSLSDLGNWKEIWKYFKNTSSVSFIKKNTHYRPWGKFINLYSGKGFLLKEIIVKPKSSISLQKHKHRSEKWVVVSGKPKITINNKKFFKKENEGVVIPKGAIHRIENIYNKNVQIVEAQIGSILKESDIVRYKDIYGRVNQ
jgi:mannose-1-phosphate guanylyltransferase/mannose-6-phosphate isomerase